MKFVLSIITLLSAAACAPAPAPSVPKPHQQHRVWEETVNAWEEVTGEHVPSLCWDWWDAAHVTPEPQSTIDLLCPGAIGCTVFLAGKPWDPEPSEVNFLSVMVYEGLSPDRWCGTLSHEQLHILKGCTEGQWKGDGAHADNRVWRSHSTPDNPTVESVARPRAREICKERTADDD